VVVNSATYTVWGESHSIAKDGGALAAEPRSDDGLSEGVLRALVHPNPVSGSRTTVSFSAPSEGTAAVEIYNILGQKVRTLARGRLSSGRHDFSWDGSDDSGRRLAGGVYLLRLQFAAGDNMHQASRRILLVR
jgi:flagellar hook assembly protein FlgD